MNKRKKNELELQRLSKIEDKFKYLGKFLYSCYKDQKNHNFELIMQEFDRDLINLGVERYE